MTLQRLFLILTLTTLAGSLSACKNAIPVVTKLSSVPGTSIVPAKDSRNFAQINAASSKQVLAGGYKANLRISQPLAELDSTATDGYKLKATVHLSK